MKINEIKTSKAMKSELIRVSKVFNKSSFEMAERVYYAKTSFEISFRDMEELVGIAKSTLADMVSAYGYLVERSACDVEPKTFSTSKLVFISRNKDIFTSYSVDALMSLSLEQLRSMVPTNKGNEPEYVEFTLDGVEYKMPVNVLKKYIKK